MYADEECLQISGIQHFAFCPRQWQLIHVEMEWSDNDLTALGQVLHRRVDMPELPQKRCDTITLRSVPLVSHRLGIQGKSDAILLSPTTSELYLTHPRYPGRWAPTPVEYKRGRPKRHNADKLQLCAEALCLEEMYHLTIPRGYIYYGETAHRLEVELDHFLRDELTACLETMHRLMREGATVPATNDSRCKRCSLKDICLPELAASASVADYYHRHKIHLP